MEDMFKKLIKVTVIGSLITTSVMIAGTILVVKKIDDSGDKIEDKKDSLKIELPGQLTFSWAKLLMICSKKIKENFKKLKEKQRKLLMM